MNEEQFLAKLNDSLKRLSEAEREDILQDFREHFEIGKEEGKQETEISASLGSPQQIAKELLAAHYVDRAGKQKSATNMLRAAWAVIGLGFFNLVIVLGPLVAVAATLIAAWAAGGVFSVAPLLFLFNIIFAPESFMWMDLFFSIFLMGGGILILLLLERVTSFLVNLFIRYLNFNIKFVNGGTK